VLIKEGEMHMLLTILGGVLLLGVFLLFGHQWGANAPSVALAAKVFVPVWLAVAIANMLVGVYHAGYTVRAELPILGIVFVAPAALAALAIWYFSKS
jgi:uncharacterized membrane protein YwaF